MCPRAQAVFKLRRNNNYVCCLSLPLCFVVWKPVADSIYLLILLALGHEGQLIHCHRFSLLLYGQHLQPDKWLQAVCDLDLPLTGQDWFSFNLLT